VETSELTTHRNPVYRKHDVIHYCVPNIPSSVARTATTAFSNIFTPILLQAADVGGIDEMIFAYKWFMNGGGSGPPNDTLRVIITDNQTSVPVDVTGVAGGKPMWQPVSIKVEEFWNKSKPFRVHFSVSDLASSGHLVEAGIDKFQVYEGSGEAPTAGFYVDQAAGCSPFTFQPVDTSTGQVSSRTWVVSGPVADTFSGPAPQITLDSAGLYDIKLIVANAFGTDEHVIPNAVEVFPTPEVSTTATATAAGKQDGTATATVNGGTPPYQYAWNDPQQQTSTTATGLPGGFYSVTITDANGCVDSSTVEVKETTGMSNLTGSKITVTPNPFSANFTINGLPAPGQATIRLVNVLGEAVPFHRNGTVLHVDPAMASGIYLLEVVDANGTKTSKKLLKQ
jgi:PKD repeat protein